MKRILVVDDNEDILEVLQIAFEARAYEVLTLLTGKETLKTVEEFAPDIILLDVYLGSINGTDICNELKQNPETKHIPIIMFSAHSNAETILNLCPAEAFVGKPFNIHHLTQVIESKLKQPI